MALKRPCLGCGVLVRGASRCPRCQAGRDQAKTARRPKLKTYSETERRRRAVADWRARYGDWCPGFHERPGRPGHPSADLTADHDGMVGMGHPEDGPLTVRCRSCNSARAAAILAREMRSPIRVATATPRPSKSGSHSAAP
jgi:5-methylcytosine-specific restriction protein A